MRQPRARGIVRDMQHSMPSGQSYKRQVRLQVAPGTNIYIWYYQHARNMTCAQFGGIPRQVHGFFGVSLRPIRTSQTHTAMGEPLDIPMWRVYIHAISALMSIVLHTCLTSCFSACLRLPLEDQEQVSVTTKNGTDPCYNWFQQRG